MSGTSLDGVDLAFCIFDYNKGWTYDLVKADTYPYAQKWQDILANAQELTETNLRDIDLELGLYYAQLIENFINEHQLVPDFISSHGHTALHRPEQGKTLQIGNGDIMCNELKMPVVNDFRKNDVLLGGQGAPLVPIGDRLLFSDYHACLNLGGFSNISYERGIHRIAFDICPVNMALNDIARIMGKDYDTDGEMGRTGDIHERLLTQLNSLSYYEQTGPRSLGREWYLKDFKKKLEAKRISPIDLMATVVEHIAIQVSRVVNKLEGKEVLITGGGAFNSFLIERLAHYCDKDLQIPEDNVINYKEAIVFGLLGVLRMRNEVNVLSSVTGASKDHCSGIIHKP
jgi:anhydro-N-acetylmuramic acid kinase